MEHVLWLGGGCGSGKSTIARALAHRLDLQLYPVDAHGWKHQRLLGTNEERGNDERWLRPSPDELAERFVRASEEKLPLILDDLDAMRGGPLVLAEGPLLFPALVAPHLGSPAHGLWLVPTEEFQESCLRKRGGVDSATSDPERALRNRLARDAILNRLNRLQAAELGLTVIEVDGGRELRGMEEVVAEHFAELIAAGPRARDGVERRRIRRAENAAIHGNITSYLKAEHISGPWPFPFVCECTTLGCTEQVLRPIEEYGRLLERASRYLIAEPHCVTAMPLPGDASPLATEP